MKTKTYADKAKSIQTRYPHADRVSADKEAMMSELEALFQEQEQKKQVMQLDNANNQFALGGDTDYFSNLANQQFGTTPAIAPTYEDYNAFNKWKAAELKSNPLLKTFAPPKYSSNTEAMVKTTEAGKIDPIKQQEFASFTGERVPWYNRLNTSDLLNAADGATAAIGNAINMGNVSDPNLITPPVVNPTFKFRGTDIQPYITSLENSARSDKYSLLSAGADFDTVVGGVNRTADTYASNLAKMTVEKGNLDNKEGARGDDIVNKGMYFNAQNMNQALIDQATRQDIADQRRRDYFNALTGNVSGMFGNAADRAYANEMGPDMANNAIFQALINANKGQKSYG